MKVQRGLGLTVLAVALLAGTPGVASAAPASSGGDAAAVAATVAAATARADATSAANDRRAAGAAGNTDVAVGRAREGRVAVGVGTDKITLTLPDIEARGVTAVGATDVLVGGEVDATVTRQAHGLQATTVVNSADAATSYTYTLTGASFRQDARAGVVVETSAGRLIGAVDPAWALDARGVAVPTRYEVRDGALVQHVDHRGATYPVVADPKITFGWYIYVRWSKQEVRDSNYAIALGGAAGFTKYVCDKLPGGWLRAGCVAIFGVYLGSIYRTWNDARSAGQCVEWRVDYDFIIVGWRRYNC
ncbi:MAG TPA: hypothetical protein VES42_15890 [Pilimelia sp.]|nr:hypothetical protein [Pilimelia sp.]